MAHDTSDLPRYVVFAAKGLRLMFFVALGAAVADLIRSLA